MDSIKKKRKPYRLMSDEKRFERLVKRFWIKVNKMGPIYFGPVEEIRRTRCWLWTGSHNKCGYGTVSVNNTCKLANRVAWLIANGKWPNTCALHKCDNPSCVNMQHLYEGDMLKNMQDRDTRGRNNQPSGEMNGQSKLTIENVSLIRKLKTEGYTHQRLADLFGVNQGHISRLVRNVSWVVKNKEESK